MNRWLLPKRSFIYEDESIEGYIVRLSQINGYEDIDEHSKIQYYYSALLTEFKSLKQVYPKVNILYNLAETLTGFEIKKCGHDRIHLSSKGLLLGHANIYYPRVTRFCPRCLSEQKYHRIQWSMIPVIICEKHLCFLRHKCYICKQITNLKATATGICNNCGNDLTKSWDVLSEQFIADHPYITKNNYLTEEIKFSKYNLTLIELFMLKKWLIFCLAKHTKCYKNKVAIEYAKTSTIIRITDSDLERIDEFFIIADHLLHKWPDNLLRFLDQEISSDERQEFINSFFKRRHSGNMSKINFLGGFVP